MARLLGTTNDKDTCDCCGRTDLKLTYAIEFDGAGDVRYYGSECAAKALKGTQKDVKAAAKQIEAERAQLVKDEQETQRRADLAALRAIAEANRAELESMQHDGFPYSHLGLTTAWQKCEKALGLGSPEMIRKILVMAGKV